MKDICCILLSLVTHWVFRQALAQMMNHSGSTAVEWCMTGCCGGTEKQLQVTLCTEQKHIYFVEHFAASLERYSLEISSWCVKSSDQKMIVVVKMILVISHSQNQKLVGNQSQCGWCNLTLAITWCITQSNNNLI